MITVELVSTQTLPVVCSYCKALIRHVPAHRDVKVGEVSHGICEMCLPAVEEQYFGNRRATA